MKYFQEVTQWRVPTPNHVYYLTDDRRKMVGYIPVGAQKLHEFSRPMDFDSRGRKFVVLDRKGEPDTVYFPKVEETQPAGQVIQVAGSGGKVYFLSQMAGRWSCTCPGYMFRRKCRHVEDAQGKE